MNDYERALAGVEAACCKKCNGLGVLNDADLGDMYCQTWTCDGCAGTGMTPRKKPRKGPSRQNGAKG